MTNWACLELSKTELSTSPNVQKSYLNRMPLEQSMMIQHASTQTPALAHRDQHEIRRVYAKLDPQLM